MVCIIMNEREWAEEALERRDYGRSMYETLLIIAKYYHACGFKRKDVQRLLETFMFQCGQMVLDTHSSNILDGVMKRYTKSPLVEVDGVGITESELTTIEALPSIPLQRLAFTLLCVAKFYDKVRPTNNHWVNLNDGDIFKLANISAPVRKQSEMLAVLNEEGLIRFSKKITNLNIQVLFVGEDKQKVFVRDFRNLGYQYMIRSHEGYFECGNCGIIDKKRQPNKGRSQKYCDACAVEVHTKQRVNSVMKHREDKELRSSFLVC